MSSIGYLIRMELKKQLRAAAEEVRTWFVLPPPDSESNDVEPGEKAFEMAVEAARQVSRFPVIEESSRRRAFIEDLRPFRNSLVLEKDGWRCFSVRFV